MASTFFGLNIGKTGLYAYQSALDTTAHNITNAETDGYSRQVIGQQAGKALKVNNNYGMAGTGVSITGVEQLRDKYYDLKFWKNNLTFGEYSTKYHFMTEIENYFNEVSGEGFNNSFNLMYDSLQELMKDSSSLTVRTQVINYGKSLAEYFNSVSESLSGIQEECNFEIMNKVEQINGSAQQIAALTKQINTLEVNGGTANDLRDQRALLLDELSEIVSISVIEKSADSGVGLSNFVVKIDNQTLVNNSSYNTLHVVPREVKHNQNDIDGLYDVAWANGQIFDIGSPTLGGSLQAMFEVRDGNNSETLRGHVTVNANDNYITMINTTINDIEKLNIPEEGKITVGNREYAYTGFEVVLDPATEKNIYTFELKEPALVGAEDTQARIGRSINYKGIPYYMAQMNEFIRTFASKFNECHRDGKDLNGNSGNDFFTSVNKVNGREYVFGPLLDSPDYPVYDFNRFSSKTGAYYTDVPEGQPFYGSYYQMTAANFIVNSTLDNDPHSFAGSSDIVNGVGNNTIVSRLINIKTDKSLFKEGTPGSFMQTLIAEIGIDTRKALNFSNSQENILHAIQNQRLSVSGVDIDEEAMNLVRFQNAYNLSAKVISVMDEIYDRLINYMGV